MPFILQDGRLVQVTDSQFAEFGGGEAQLRRTTAAERRARREAETAAAGGQNIQVSDPAAPSNNQEIINPNTANNTPGQTLTPVAAPLREEDIPAGSEALFEYNLQGDLVAASSLRNPRPQSEGVPPPEAPPIPGLDRPRGFQADSVAFTPEELNAAGITNIPPGTPLRADNTEPGAIDPGADPATAGDFDPNAGFPALTPTVIVADPTIIQDETGAISNLRRNPETGDIFEPLPPEVDPNAGFPASLPESVSAFESGYPDPNAEFDPNAGFPPLTPESTESEVVPGFSADPRIAGENVGLVTAPAPLTESEVIGDFSADPRIAGENVVSDASIAKAAVDNARNQQSIREQRGNNVDSADWRVRLRLAPAADYLYKAANPGILQPLAVSDGVIFPYTPSIQTVYKANYTPYNLTHSNYRGFFYQGSAVEDINITGVFTAQDSTEAAYLLAVIHFFRSATKMFYGQDGNRGAPPPLVYLSAMGESQYVDAPCVIGQFNYNLPTDVDYVRAGAPNQNGTNLLKRRDRQYLPTNRFSSALQRLQNARAGGLPRGGEIFPPPPPTLGLSRPTYVPTRMEISIILHPMQSRQQVSQQFSLKEYGTGKLQPRGFW